MIEKTLWTLYDVSWVFLTSLCGSVPADENIIKKWLEARQARVRPPGGKSIEEVNEEVLASLERGEGEPDTEYSKLVFQRHNGGLAMRAATTRAHMKDCARVLSAQWIGKIKGERAFSTKVINGVYPDESVYWIPILRADGTPVTEPDGEREKPVHARGIRGEPINALKCFEYVLGARMDFRLKVLGNSVKESDLVHLFNYGGTHGYAGERSDGEGRYIWTLKKVEGAEAKRGRKQKAVS